MIKDKKDIYQDCEVLRDIIKDLKGRKFRLDCGHHLTVGFFLGNDVIILNGKEPQIICSACGG